MESVLNIIHKGASLLSAKYFERKWLKWKTLKKYWNAYNTPEEVLEIVNYIISHPSVKWEPLVYAIWGEAEIKISKYSKTIVLKLLVAERQLLLMKTAWFIYLRSDSHQRAIKLRFLTSKPGQNNSNVTSCSNLRPSASFLSTRKSVRANNLFFIITRLSQQI